MYFDKPAAVCSSNRLIASTGQEYRKNAEALQRVQRLFQQIMDAKLRHLNPALIKLLMMRL